MSGPDLTVRVDVPRKYHLRRTLGGLRMGGRDPSVRAAGRALALCFHTPDGPVTVEAGHRPESVEVRAWGPGSGWVRPHLPGLLGLHDRPQDFRPTHPVVLEMHQRQAGLHLPRLPRVFHRVIQVIAMQLVKSSEATRSWRRMAWDFGDPAPGPQGLVLPPSAERLAGLPESAFVAHGVPHKQARAMVRAAREAETLESAAQEGHEALGQAMLKIPGLGPWTVGYVCGTAMGHADALLPGDYGLPRSVAWMLAREAQADDDRMFELLEPFRGHRFRVVKLVWVEGKKATRSRPRRPDRPLEAWRDRETR